MKKTFAAVVTALALIAAPAFAQSPAAVDPAAAAAVKDLLVSMRFRDMSAAALQQMEQRIPQQIRTMVGAQVNADPKLSAGDKQKAMAKVEAAIPGLMAALHTVLADPALLDEMVAETVPLYARTFTADEIRQLAAFYATPLGQKMLASMPKVMAESMEIGNRIMGPRMHKLMQQAMQSVDNQK